MTSNRDIGDQDLAGTIEEKLVPIIEGVIDSYGLAGLAIGIVRGSEVVFTRGFGKRSVDTGEPVTAHSLFHMTSVSKPFVATAIMQLREGGRVDLDAPVTAYLPYFELKGGETGQITIRHLLSHTGGVPDTEDYLWHEPEYDDGALERYVRSLAGEEMLDAPGKRFAYSNPAFEVLGDVIAKVSGQPFESYVKGHILDPLGMRNSTFLRREVSTDLATTPHFGAPLVVLPNVYPYNRAHAPSSTLHSSAADMCEWALANLAHGALNGRQILSEDSHETLWRPIIETGEETWGEVSCLGWYLGTYRGRPVVHHSGADPGYFADLVLLPEMQLGVVVMSNAYSATAWGITDAALDVVLGLQPTAPRRPITVPVGSLLRSAGRDAAIAEYRRLQSAAPEEYDFDEARFNDVTWGATWIHSPEAVMPMLEVWTTLLPESSKAHEALGRSYLVRGDSALAARTLHSALELDPESETIPRLLRQLDGR